MRFPFGGRLGFGCGIMGGLGSVLIIIPPPPCVKYILPSANMNASPRVEEPIPASLHHRSLLARQFLRAPWPRDFTHLEPEHLRHIFDDPENRTPPYGIRR